MAEARKRIKVVLRARCWRERSIVVLNLLTECFFFFSSRRRHTRFKCDWSSDVCSSDLIERPFKEIVGARFERRIPVEYVYQELAKLPPGFSAPVSRQKPWGTGHAILMAAEEVHEPFAAINADDFYGRNSFQLLARHLQSGGADYCMVGFVLKNTLSEFGSVARGVCSTTPEDFLEIFTELTRIEPHVIATKYTDANGQSHALTGHETVSMNMWGFQRPIFEPHHH